MQPTQDLNILDMTPLITPRQLKEELPITEKSNATVVHTREAVRRVLDGSDSRLMVTVGPCSIHDEAAGIEYARRLATLAKSVEQQLLVVMRVYFEKPRTTVGWKGLINDPHLNDTFDIAEGMRKARRILLAVTEMGLATATEMLEPVTPQYIADLVTLSAIGARTTESPTHRQMASGLSMPVGFKNGTDGGLQVAIDALQAAWNRHAFLGIDQDGRTSIVFTKGNRFGHLILRGGRDGVNYTAQHIGEALRQLEAAKLPPRLVVDCSHANSGKDHRRQAQAWNDVIQQRVAGNTGIIGLMLESNLLPGSQKLTKNLKDLTYGVSVTDACIGWEETEALILDAYKLLEPRMAPAHC